MDDALNATDRNISSNWRTYNGRSPGGGMYDFHVSDSFQ